MIDPCFTKRIEHVTQQIECELTLLSKLIFENPELGYQERFAYEQHIRLLEKHGFSIEKSFLGFETGFKAVFSGKKPGPKIAYLSEYDALPEIGHGCGHNILGAVSTGAGIVLRYLVEEIGGTVCVFGTPAEESDGSKVCYAERGAFDGIDAAMLAHPSSSYKKSTNTLALTALQCDFYGRSAHAAISPDRGVNALDAIIQMFNSISALRQHISCTARINGIIIHGGDSPNTIPEHTVGRFYVRAGSLDYMNGLVEKVKKCAEGAATATGCTVGISYFENSFANMNTNHYLSDLFTGYLCTFGVPRIHTPDIIMASFDMGNVSYCCPAIHPYFDITGNPEIKEHTTEFANATCTAYAHEQMLVTIAALVSTAVDIIQDPRKLTEIREEFTKSSLRVPSTDYS